MSATPGLRSERPARRRRGDPERRVRAELERAAEALALRGRRVLVAASGGLDSSVLADALARAARRGGFELVGLAHVHHGLRGTEADADQACAAGLAARLGVAFGVRRIDPAARCESARGRARPTLQEAARGLRYEALEEIAAELGADCIATAHHADDQAETVLLRLLRGTGPDGLGGIPERSPDGRRVRPLLRVARADLEAYARARGLVWREDASNASPRYARNRLRRWLPGLARAFNPRLLRALADLAEAQRRDTEWIRGEVEREALLRFRGEGDWLRIETEGWSGLPEALARRLAREALVRGGAARGVERVHLERMIELLANPTPPRAIELPGGLRLVSRRDGVRLGPLPSTGETVC